ncbi:MAG: energy transducer TonB [Steroidobacterales bacterium]|jgi:protein TonB
MTAYVQDSSFLTRRGAVLAAIVALHVFLIWALASGLARRAMELVAPPISADIVEEIKKQDLPPPPPPPELERPPVEVPPPDVQIDMPVETNTTAIQDVTDKPVVRPPPKPAASVAPTTIGPGRGMPSPDDYYPGSARRLGQEGTAMVSLCVGPDGKLSAAPTVSKSSGTASLDEAAVKYAQATSGHWKPATEDGKPINKCNQLPVKFKLN